MTFLSFMAQGGCEVAFALHSAKQGSPGRLLEVGGGGRLHSCIFGSGLDVKVDCLWQVKNLLLGETRWRKQLRRRRTDSGARAWGSLDCQRSLSVCQPQPLPAPGLNPTLAFLVDWFWPFPLSGAEHRSGFYCCDRRRISHTVQKCLINFAGPCKGALFQCMHSSDEF